MLTKSRFQEQLQQLFVNQKCWTIKNLSQALDYSTISVRRVLKQIGYLSSFTHNSKWYTLHSIPAFDNDGLWFYHDIGFSKHGNLKKTILYFVNKNRQGLSAMQLTEKLLTPCHAVVNQMYKNEVIDRIKGQKNFIYLSVDEKKKKRQLAHLQSLRQIKVDERKPKPLSAQTAVYVLVEFIKNPQASFTELSKVVTKKQVIAEPQAIAQFFEDHGLKKISLQR